MKKIVYVGRNQEKYEVIKKIAPEGVVILFMNDEPRETLEKTRKRAEFWSNVLKMPVLTEGLTAENEVVTSFLSYIEPECTKIYSISKKNNDMDGLKANFEALKCHM